MDTYCSNAKRTFCASEWAKALWHRARAVHGRPQGGYPTALAMAILLARRASPEHLDAHIGRDPRRLLRYNTARWCATTLRLEDLSVWPGMGGLPSAWCKESVRETGERVSATPEALGGTRFANFMETIVNHPDEMRAVVQALPLIAFREDELRPGSTRSTPFTLDDGCHRALALALVAADEPVRVLLGRHPMTRSSR